MSICVHTYFLEDNSFETVGICIVIVLKTDH